MAVLSPIAILSGLAPQAGQGGSCMVEHINNFPKLHNATWPRCQSASDKDPLLEWAPRVGQD